MDEDLSVKLSDFAGSRLDDVSATISEESRYRKVERCGIDSESVSCDGDFLLWLPCSTRS